MDVSLIRLMRRTSPVLRGTESPAIKAIVDRRYHFQEDNDVRHFYLAAQLVVVELSSISHVADTKPISVITCCYSCEMLFQ